MRNPSETTRLTITVPVSTKEAINELASRMGVSESYATQHLIKIGMTAEAVAFAGGEIVAHLPNGKIKVIADQNGNYLQRLMTVSASE
jgi:redox-regulated HSP33 family molecular chaperone